MPPRFALIGTFLAVGLGAVSQGDGTVPALPCPAGVVAQPTFVASDQDELGKRRLIATHTIQVATDFGATPVDVGSVRWVVPATAKVIPAHGDVNGGPGGLIFFSDTSGATLLAATWTQDDGSSGKCVGDASTTVQLQRADPMPRLKDLRALEHLHPNLKFDLLWRFATDLGPTADLDPVTVMARGVGVGTAGSASPDDSVPLRYPPSGQASARARALTTVEMPATQPIGGTRSTAPDESPDHGRASSTPDTAWRRTAMECRVDRR